MKLLEKKDLIRVDHSLECKSKKTGERNWS